MIFLKEYLAYAKVHRKFVIFGTISLLAYIYLALNSQAYAELSLFEMWMVCVPCAALSFYLCWYYSQQKKQGLQFPVSLMLIFAVLYRLVGITTFPILEDDIYRFLWDGRMTIETGTAYGWIPLDFFADLGINEHFDEILGLINHPEIATIYGPVLQMLFAAAYVIAPGEIWPLQIAFALADIGIIFLLLRIAKARYVLLYAWSPLIIKEFSITAHPDVLGAFFLVLAFYAYHCIYSSKINNKNQQKSHITAWLCITICLALAVGVKIFALILAPLLLRFKWQYWLIFFTALLIQTLPFAINYPSNDLLLGIQSVWFPPGLKAMANDWLFNAPLYFLAKTLFSITTAKLVFLTIFASVAGVYFFRLYLSQQHLPIRIDRLYGLFFLCIPVLNPWYLVWLLPFAAIYPSYWAWTASIAVLLSYASGINLAHLNLENYQLYQQPMAILAIEFILIAAALWIDLRHNHDKNQPPQKMQ